MPACVFWLADTVNIASRMESSSEPMRVQVSVDTAELLRLACTNMADALSDRGATDIKGKGEGGGRGNRARAGGGEGGSKKGFERQPAVAQESKIRQCIPNVRLAVGMWALLDCRPVDCAAAC